MKRRIVRVRAEVNGFGCLGFGVLAGIDLDARRFLILVPRSVSEGALAEVNCLSSGAVSLPEAMLLKRQEEQLSWRKRDLPQITGRRPYLGKPKASAPGATPWSEPWQKGGRPK